MLKSLKAVTSMALAWPKKIVKYVINCITSVGKTGKYGIFAHIPILGMTIVTLYLFPYHFIAIGIASMVAILVSVIDDKFLAVIASLAAISFTEIIAVVCAELLLVAMYIELCRAFSYTVETFRKYRGMEDAVSKSACADIC